MAKQAAGSAMVRFGDTMVLAAVTVSSNVSTLPFFPLTVEYREKTYAAGKIPGGFLKREGRPSDKEILASRLIDRSIRPLFPEGFKNEVQVFVTVLSADQENDADILGVDRGLQRAQPLAGPVERPPRRRCASDGWRATGSSIRPSSSSSSPPSTWSSAASADSIVMVEGGSLEVSEAEILEALKVAQKGIKDVIGLERQLMDKAGAAPKMAWVKAEVDAELQGRAADAAETAMAQAINAKDKAVALRRSEGGEGAGAGRAPRRVSRAGPRDRRPSRGHRVPGDAEAGAGQGRAGGRPGPRHHPADLDRDRRAAAHPRLGALHPGPDPGAGLRHPRHHATTSSGSTASTWPARRPSRSCCTTTSRRTPPAR